MSGVALMDSVLQSQHGVRRLTAGWLLLALGALAVSTLCAVLLIVARVPWSGTHSGFGDLFGRALVLHVSLAVVVWFLACAAALWTLASGAVASHARWTALASAVSGLAAMVLALFLKGAQPVLANYVPVLNHPVFFVGLALFAMGVALSGTLSVPQLLRNVRHSAVWHLGALLAIGVAGVALTALLATAAQVAGQAGFARFELLAWGPGHVLQFVHMILLMSVWTVLAEPVLAGRPIAPRRWLMLLLVLAAAPVLGVPVIYFNYAIDSAEFRRAFTLLMAWGIWPAAAVLAVRLLWQIARARRAAWQSENAPALVLSLSLFLIGCVLGALIRDDSTLVPAHYHGTVGAVTLAYMALGYRLLSAFGGQFEGRTWVRWQPVLYGAGLTLLVLGLAWSGWLGVPRKSSHMEGWMAFPGYFVAMGFAAFGGLLAIGGAAWFIVNIVRAVWFANGTGESRRPHRGDVRGRAIALTLAAVAALGVLLAYVSDDSRGTPVANSLAAPEPAHDHANQMRKAELDRRFASGVVLLNTKKFDLAASEFHRVLELAPKMPEAHTNMGFALVGTQRYALAKDFFNSAIDLNPGQLNAYYGLAIALEGLQDLAGALGAMRSYAHLSTADDPYLAKANAAIWEWDGELKKVRLDKSAKPADKPR